ncbi:E3 ubiquitin-protein ligase [Nymphaea thermarum]|nr:E3 ubiquitin-protein ligase [Nymphaea thermarum]
MTSIGSRQRHLLISRLSASLSSLFRRSYSSSGTLSSPGYSPSTNDVNDGAAEAEAVELLSWGRGSCGQLGGGVEESRLYPTTVSSFHLPSGFGLSPVSGRLTKTSSPASVEVGISCGLFHSAVLIGGKIWVWGKGDGGRLGLGNEESIFTPVLNPNLENVRSIALGGLHSCALTTNGDVFTWGYGGFGALGHSVYHRELLPRLLEYDWNGKISHLATSGTHTAAVSELVDVGELFTWGRDEGEGRLGLGSGGAPDEGALGIPTKVEALPVPIAAVACGGFFTMALTADGQLWSWGDKGKVLTWGHGRQGQLGHGSKQNGEIPKEVEGLLGEHIVYVACGSSSSAAITDEGKLYMWGNAKDFQLGVPGLPEIQPFPVEVKFLMDEALSPHVLSVAIGATHSMCLVRTDKSQS